jgi:hypothetical protein
MSQVSISLTLTVRNREDLLAQIREAIRFSTVHKGEYTVRIDFGGTGLKPGHAPDGGGILGEDDS